MPRGSRPSTAALTRSGARKASEIVRLTCRTLHLSRAAICSALAILPVTISSSQRRPRAIDVTSAARVLGAQRSKIARRCVPLGRSIAQASDANAARQSSFDGSLHEVGRQERERDRHVDLSNTAFVAGSNLLDTGHGAGNNLIKPMPAACDRCDECGTGLSANLSTVVRRHASRRDDIASPSHWRLLPWDAQDNSIMVHRVRRNEDAVNGNGL